VGRSTILTTAAVLLWSGAFPAYGQMRGHAPARMVAASPAAAARSPRIMTVHTSRPPATSSQAAVVVTPSTTGTTAVPLVFPSDFFGTFPTPGLGFDFVHFAAINRGAGVRALIDPVTQHQLALALRLQAATTPVSPFFFSPFGGGTPIVVESPIVVVPQAPASEGPHASVQERRPSESYFEAQRAPQEEPGRDAGEFVLVQLDGRLLFAVGFTAEPGRVVYVTREGLRRSISLTQLDVDATQRMNEERGTSIQIPKA
jgi:hypothetical protein